MIKRMFTGLLLAACALNTFAYSSLDELMADMNKKQVEAIRNYIEANPEAEDVAEARERLIYGLVSVDDFSGALAILEKSYQDLPADKSALELNSAFGELVVPMIQLYRMEGAKEKALVFIESVREDFKSHTMAEMINEALDEFLAMFDQPGVGDELEISFTTIDGREVNLADLKGKVVLVDFWATWCLPCVKAMPAIKAVYDEFHEQGFEIIGISLDSDREKLDEFIAREKLDWPQYYDGEGWDNEIARRYGIDAIPATFLIGRDGLIAATDIADTALKAQVAALLATPVAAE